MSAPLLATKLYIPPARENAVPRPRLVGKLLAGLSHPAGFMLLSGPAGFGKTTLLSELVSCLRQPVAWVSIDEGDNDATRFWSYLIAACRSVCGEVGEAALELLATPQPVSEDTIPTILINDLSAFGGSIVLVLDDYHEIQNPAIHAGLLFLLEHLPPNLHLLISTRSDPPWPLSRFRARNQLVELRAHDLRFSKDETAQFLTHSMGIGLSDEDITALEERTEGWAAGLQLAAISLQGRSDVSSFIKAFSGSQIYIAEYLFEEVLGRLPEGLRAFLLQTSILKRMNASLCEAVTDCSDGHALLQSLQQANIFIIPLDNEGWWYRYHHLFADLLRARLGQSLSTQAIAALQLRAAEWFERNGFVREAVDHTLAAEDFERAAALVDDAGRTILFSEQSTLLYQWLQALPEKAFHMYPRLQVYRVFLELSLGKKDMFERTLQDTEDLIQALPASPENEQLRTNAMAYLCQFYAHQNTTRAIQIAHRVLDESPHADPRLHASIYSALYRAHGMAGDIEASAPAYRECLRLGQAARAYALIANTTMVRAFDLCQYGRLDEAAEYCQLILDAGDRSQHKVFYPAGPSYVGLGGIYLERNQLEAAEAYLNRGVELCRQGAMYGLYTAYAQWSRLHQAQGDLDKAWEVLRLLERSFQRWDFTLTARQVSLRLAMGDLDGASRLAAPILEVLGESKYSQKLPRIAEEAFKLCLARIYIAEGEIDTAIRLLGEIQATVEPGKRFGRLLEVNLLRGLAITKQAGGEITPTALTHLEQALELAEPAGFVLLFLEEGAALIPMLAAVAERRGAPGQVRAYARMLLQAFESGEQPATISSASPETSLVEALTPREMEVLGLLATGDSNQAIADKLVITVRTVKKHTSNIYAKLETGSRTQAVARARQIGLLSTD